MAKYIVTRADGTPISEDEPCFVIRASDVFALAVVSFYMNISQGAGFANGAGREFGRQVYEHFCAIDRWQRAHPPKIPD